MATPNKTLAGFQASLWAQNAAGTPLTTANLSVWTGQVQTIVGASANGTGTAGRALNVEEIPEFGFDDASASFGVAGSRFSDKIVTQSAPTSLTVVAAYNPSDVGLSNILADATSGTAERTYVIAFSDGTDTFAYSFNARVGQFKVNPAVGAETKVTFTLHPRGGQYGFSNN